MNRNDDQSAIHNPQSAIVFKLGGSLLDVPDLPRIIDRVLAQRPGHAPLLVVGGGTAANVVREWDRVHQLGDEMAHDLALETMGLNESLVLRLIPGARLVRNEKQFQAVFAEHAEKNHGFSEKVGFLKRRVLPVLCASCFLPWAESQGHAPLPRSWDVTSDSIAAWVARVLHADELVLLKSADLPLGLTARDASQHGLVDANFPTVGADVPRISWCNARKVDAVITPWLPL